MTDNTGKPVIAITGASGNLGSAVSELATSRGYQVAKIIFATDPNQPTTDDILVLPGVDLSDRSQAESAMRAIQDKFGRIDALLNIAGGFCWETFADNDLDSWDRMFKLNLKTAITATRAALPYMKKQQSGAIVCISAAASFKAEMGMGPYAASKAGVARFVEALAEETKLQNIRVNAVAPGVLDTPVNRKNMPDADFSTWVAPAALAEVLLFLCSDAARAITGVVLPVTNKT